MAVEVAAAEEEVEDLVVVETEMEGIGMEEEEEETDMEVVGDMTETGMVVDTEEVAAEAPTEEAMVGIGTDHTDRERPRNYTATHSALFLFNCNVNTTYRCVELRVFFLLCQESDYKKTILFDKIV